MQQGSRCVGPERCEELGGSQDNTFWTIYEGNPGSRRVLSRPRLRVIADVSPLTFGHLLVVPTDHYLSFAQVVADIGDEVTELLDEIAPLYAATFGEPLLFEHGSSVNMASACISHAHLHLLPIDGDRFNFLLMRDGLVPIPLVGMSRLSVYSAESYFLSGYQSQIFVFKATKPMKGQYLRSIAGECLDIPDPLWDYSLVIRRELLRTTMHRTSGWSSAISAANSPVSL